MAALCYDEFERNDRELFLCSFNLLHVINRIRNADYFHSPLCYQCVEFWASEWVNLETEVCSRPQYDFLRRWYSKELGDRQNVKDIVKTGNWYDIAYLTVHAECRNMDNPILKQVIHIVVTIDLLLKRYKILQYMHVRQLAEWSKRESVLKDEYLYLDNLIVFLLSRLLEVCNVLQNLKDLLNLHDIQCSTS